MSPERDKQRQEFSTFCDYFQQDRQVAQEARIPKKPNLEDLQD